MADDLSFRLHLERGAAFTLDVSETIPMRGVTAITGPSGSGKTTLLRALAGLDKSPGDDMRIAFRGTTWDGPAETLAPEARRIGFVFQDPHLFPHMTVEQNLRYGARRRDVTAIDGIVEALDLAPFLARRIHGLSGGEARRVALGRALAANPQILFLDEPLSGLDLDRKAEVLPYLARAVGEARVPALYVTHSTDEITTLADRILSLDKGRIAGWESPPMTLAARVVGHAGEKAIVEIEGDGGEAAHLQVAVRARLGERVRLGLPAESIMLSGTHPGRTSATTVLPGEVIEIPEEGAGPVVSIFGQKIRLPRPGPELSGSRVWVSVLRILPRPEPDDSQG